MRNKILLSIVSFVLISITFACKSSSKVQVGNAKADQFIDAAIKAHGGDKYNKAHYQFVFRDKTYTFKNNNDRYEYILTTEKEGTIVKTILNNNGLTRTGTDSSLSEKQKKGISSSINSVIYFATLPYKLKDKAVNKKYVGSIDIKSKAYEVVQISFDKNGGGTDHDDVFYYWINKKTYLIDYLAYNYQVNGGGVRFRSAYNTRKVGGIVFQDYINYKAEVGTILGELPGLWEQGKLEELSRIETENVKQLSTN